MNDAVKSAVSNEIVKKARNAFKAKCGITIYMPGEGGLS